MAAEYKVPEGCEVCGGPVQNMGCTTTALRPGEDGTFRAWKRNIWACRNCGHRTSEGPYAYEEHYARLGAETTRSRNSAKGLQKALKGCLKAGSAILDIGCNTGDLLHCCFECHRLFGVELNHGAAKVANEGGVEILAPTLEQMDLEQHRRRFDAIFAFDLIEHVPDAAFLLHCCRELLKPGGLLVIETGCASALVPRLEGRRWYYLRFFEHVRAFTQDSMRRALESAGFRTLRIRTQSHSASQFRRYGKRGILGLLANGAGLNKPSPDRDGPVFFPYLDHQLVLAQTPEPQSQRH